MAKKARWEGRDTVIDDTGMHFKVGWYQKHPVKTAAARGALKGLRRGDRLNIELVPVKQHEVDKSKPALSRARIL